MKKREFTKGAFSQEEVDSLLKALCHFASQQDNPLDVLTILCTKSKTEMPQELFGAWPKIAECLPNRSV